MNHNKVPQLFVGSGASKWSDYKKYPWTMGWQPNYRTEAQIYMKYMLANVKNPKLGHPLPERRFRQGLSASARATSWAKDWDKIVVKSVSYETTDATIDSQIAELQGSGANVLLCRGDSQVCRTGDPQGLRPAIGSRCSS